MQLFVYRLVYPMLWVISKLPWRLLYFLSSTVYILVYHIIGYRKKVVTKNLTLAFPEKPIDEIYKIRKKFYKHMCDMFMEMIKSLSISKEEMTKRFTILDPHTFKEIQSHQKSIIVLMGHYASYEWAIAAQFAMDFPIVGVYKKIKNKHFDQLAHRIRGRFNTRLIRHRKVIKEITRDKVNGKLCAYGLLSDQSPKLKNALYWTDFMNIKVPVITGGEVLAKRLDMPVMYLKVEKIKRGYYQAKFIKITDDPKNCEDHFITKNYLSLLENQIKENPEYYLWTHRRWKHRNTKIPKSAVVD
ncbi:KDO2-lipid IV(A) lauroyltransferase [Aquimarina sp. EL_43]|uniref:lysophospholipid acyltransferase family protein n=1 Tax=Aquimarina TaxID=290174 RepID=UPI000471A12F|nr:MULTISPECIES: lysophospholipid acyltransferase family protein [Aquimarina]MBG6133538.1 KDO2-lipid IV(A) lauroyltransferase [Aquimarina sp. EL_35]MBG6153669.1 KDO2-lipid IV(A) lauroyltransferase [Aquimarina sp. EL_32]MBG6171852.1 KDO2-lipid IV(A) lauroyltransferase [Aquimarina sp. EL_43]